MKIEEIKNKVGAIVTRIMETPAAPEADIRNDLGGDSLDMLEVEMALEREFGTYIEIGMARTVNEISGIVKNKIG